MTIQHIGTRAVSLYISGSELTELDLAPEEIGCKEARWLLAQALEQKRLGGWEAAELTVYPGVDSVLLFARRRADSPCYFFFSDFEALITAAHLCPETLSSTLSRFAPGYVLTVYPFEGEAPPPVLYEFATELSQTPYLALHLAEQGAVLFVHGAISRLRAHFAPQF